MGPVILGPPGVYTVHNGKMQAPAVSLSLAGDGDLAGQFVHAAGAGVHHVHDAKRETTEETVWCAQQWRRFLPRGASA